MIVKTVAAVLPEFGENAELHALTPPDGAIGRYRLATARNACFVRVSARIGDAKLEQSITAWLGGHGLPVSHLEFAGLALAFGIMRLVNIAHGDFIVLAAFMLYGIGAWLGIGPLGAALVVAPLMAGLGYLLQRRVLNRVSGSDPLPSLLVTFGLSVIIQNALLRSSVPMRVAWAAAGSKLRVWRLARGMPSVYCHW